MTFDDVIIDLRKMVGLQLESIRAGANIVLAGLNLKDERIELVDANGSRKTWPMTKIQYLWEEMLRKPAIHVDSLLGGSGSSRNQPETLLANLPYVEWARIEGKKHIAFVGKPTHPHGTLMPMDSLRIEQIRQKLRQEPNPSVQVTILIITSEIRKTIDSLERVTSQKAIPIHPGMYEFTQGALRLLVSLESSVPSAKSGSYILLPGRLELDPTPPITILNENYRLLTIPGINLLLKQP